VFEGRTWVSLVRHRKSVRGDQEENEDDEHDKRAASKSRLWHLNRNYNTNLVTDKKIKIKGNIVAVRKNLP
jgi:hypothetical protein